MPAAGGALLVSNHSGGMLTPDVLVFAPEFYKHFGFDRPLYTLGHYGIFLGPIGDLLRRAGVIEASRENAGGGTAFRRRRAGVPRRRLRLVPADLHRERRRLRRPHRICPHGGRIGCADRADGVDRRAGDPSVPRPRRLDRAQARPDQGPPGDPAHQLRLPVRPVRDLPAEPSLAVQDRHPGSRPHRRDRGVRREPRRRRGRPARPGGHAGRRSTTWPTNVDSRSWVERSGRHFRDCWPRCGGHG